MQDGTRLEGIRQRMARLAAEFLIIVIGVLSALAVDQWRDDRKDRELARFYLAALEDDLRADSSAIAQAVERAEEVGQAAVALDQLVRSADAPPDSLEFLLEVEWLLSAVNVRPNTATFEDMTGSGNSRLLRNPELRNRLQRYTNLVRSIREGITENARGVERNSLPPALLDPSISEGLRLRLQSQGDSREILPAVMDPAAVLQALRRDPGNVGEFLRRRQLHAAYVVGDLTWLLENRTIPMLADIRSERAGRPLAVRE